MEKEIKKENAQKLDISQDIAGGIYSNMVMISHSPNDFVMDFIALLPGMPAPQVKSRIIMVPEHAKRALMALAENIQRYEQQFGEIKLENQTAVSNPTIPFPFSKGEA